MASVHASMGLAFQQWALGLVACIGYRAHFERSHGAPLKDGDCELRSEVQIDRQRPDFVFTARSTRTHLIAECKWTSASPFDKFVLAFKSLDNITKGAAHPPDKVIIVGSKSARLDEQAVAEYLAAPEYGYQREWPYQPLTSGTSVMRYHSLVHGDLTIVNVIAGTDGKTAVQECGVAAAILLTIAAPNELAAPPNELALQRLASSCLVPRLLKHLHLPDLGKRSLEHTQTVSELWEPGFVLDPWSYVLQEYVAAVRRDRPVSQNRWVSLLREAVNAKGRQCGVFQLTPSSDSKMASLISPIPLRCGTYRNVQVVRELSIVVPWARPGEGEQLPTIRIMRGPAGAGKSTLIEYLYNSHVEQLWRAGGAGHRLGFPVFIDLQRDAAKLRTLPDSIDDEHDGAYIAVIEELIGTGANEPSLSTSRLAALFTRFRISLYVDGYDQLAPSEAVNLTLLGRWLKKMGSEFTYLLLSSRPGHNELMAFDWEETFGRGCVPDPASVLSLAPPDLQDVRDYCQSWLDILKQLKKYKDSEALKASSFFDWLNRTGGQGASQDVSVEAIQSNPLLLAMALSIYIRRLSDERTGYSPIIRTRADLFEALISDVAQAKYDSRFGDDHGGSAVLQDLAWRERFERLCFESLTRAGKTIGRIDQELLEEENFVDQLKELPFVRASTDPLNAEQGIEFAHPTFHEYFAAHYLAQCDLTPFGARLGELVISFGRDAFKLLLGCLISRPASLKPFFELLDRDVSIQQYLYDAGYVDICLDELRLVDLLVRDSARAHRCVSKLVAHKYYGSRDDLELGINCLIELYERLGKDSDPLSHWYKLFCVDHIENRVLRVNRQDLVAWVEENQLRLTSGLSIYAAGAGMDGTVREPVWASESMFILRCAHYWGHVGNRKLNEQVLSAADDMKQSRRAALDAYDRAIVYRAVSIALGLRENLGVEILQALDVEQRFPDWFRHWLVADHASLLTFERFVGPVQALGDTAHQYLCRADIRLWEALHASHREALLTAMNGANADKEVADRLWDLAKSEKFRGLLGEGLLRYFILGAGVEQRLELMLEARHRAVRSAAEVRGLVKEKLARLERQYGMRYELGTEDVLKSTEAFRSVLEARERARV